MKQKKRPRKKPSESEIDGKKVLQDAKSEKKRLTVNGVYLPEKEDKTNMMISSYRISKEKYISFFNLCSKHNISRSEALNAMIDNFLNENTNE